MLLAAVYMLYFRSGPVGRWWCVYFIVTNTNLLPRRPNLLLALPETALWRHRWHLVTGLLWRLLLWLRDCQEYNLLGLECYCFCCCYCCCSCCYYCWCCSYICCYCCRRSYFAVIPVAAVVVVVVVVAVAIVVGAVIFIRSTVAMTPGSIHVTCLAVILVRVRRECSWWRQHGRVTSDGTEAQGTVT